MMKMLKIESAVLNVITITMTTMSAAAAMTMRMNTTIMR